MGWSVKGEAEASLSFASSLPDVEKPFWLSRLCAGTEMIGAGSWLPPVCLEKLQEISGAATFFVVTQTAKTDKTLKMHEIKVGFMIIIQFSGNLTFLNRW